MLCLLVSNDLAYDAIRIIKIISFVVSILSVAQHDKPTNNVIGPHDRRYAPTRLHVPPPKKKPPWLREPIRARSGVSSQESR